MTTAVPLVEHFAHGLDAPICLTWELTYACNLACSHCLSSSGRRDPRELTTDEARAIIDELQRMQVFYVNIGGGEPTVRSDFWELLDYATAHDVGVKFSTNGIKIDLEGARRIAANSYVDIQISIDGATADVNDAVRGAGSYDVAVRALQHLSDVGVSAKLSVVCTRYNIPQLDQFKEIADRYGAQLRLTRLRPSGRGADVWEELHPTQAQQRELYGWLVLHGEGVLTGDSFFHLAAYGKSLPGLNLCGAGRVVCLIDPVGDVYACPFAIHEQFLAGNVRSEGGFAKVWRESDLFLELRQPDDHLRCELAALHVGIEVRAACHRHRLRTMVGEQARGVAGGAGRGITERGQPQHDEILTASAPGPRRALGPAPPSPVARRERSRDTRRPASAAADSGRRGRPAPSRA